MKGVACIALSSDGQTIFSGGSDCTIRVFSLESGAELACLTGHKELVRCVAVMPSSDGDPETTTIVSGSYDGSIIIWTLKGNQQWPQARMLDLQTALRRLEGGEKELSPDAVRPRVISVVCDESRIICASEHKIVGWNVLI